MKSRLIHLLAAAGLFPLTDVSAEPDALWKDTPFTCYEVPAISSVPRLPNRLSSDAKLSGKLHLIAAQGEFEPASFVIVPRKGVEKLELKHSELIGPKGTIPAENVDLKIVKCWYQAGTAWYSYFQDANRRELVPELLLNDENLVKVDLEKKENYLRVGEEYRWISYPKEKAGEGFFNYHTEPVADSKTLLPIKLSHGENKQIWVTVKVPEEAAAGIYSGTIQLVADGRPAGSMELKVKVLPFKLPMPKTYYNLDLDYLVSIYAPNVLDMCERLKIPREIADKQQMAIYRNLLDHNVFNNRAEQSASVIRNVDKAIEDVKHELRLMKKAGFVMKPLLTRAWGYYAPGEEKKPELFKARIDALTDAFENELGHKDVYLATWDEAGVTRTKVIRELAEYVNSKGLKLWATTAKGRHFDLAGYSIDYANHGGWFTREDAQTWHSVGAKVASYAGPHTGPENPDIFRRLEGLARYKANYDGSFNYEYFSALHPTISERLKKNVWNDFHTDAFRQMNMVYPTPEGMIDTIAWEGFREGIDDVRYATKLKQDAEKAISSGKMEAMHTAKKALMWLELLDDRTADLNAVRLEMIEHISKINDAMNK